VSHRFGAAPPPAVALTGGGAIIGFMDTYQLIEVAGGGFTVEVSDGEKTVNVRHFVTEDEANDWIAEQEEGADDDPLAPQ
jgi:hypothetical protein